MNLSLEVGLLGDGSAFLDGDFLDDDFLNGSLEVGFLSGGLFHQLLSLLDDLVLDAAAGADGRRPPPSGQGPGRA